MAISDRIIEVIDDRQTGETILDEALKMMKMQQQVEKLGINAWVDLLSGQYLSLNPWNFMFFLIQYPPLHPCRLNKKQLRRNMERHENWVST